MIKLWQGVAMSTDRDSQAGSIPACHISPVKVCDGVATVTTSRYAYHDDELAGWNWLLESIVLNAMFQETSKRPYLVKQYERHMYVGSIPTGLIVQFSDRTQLAMTPSDTGRASWVADHRD